MSLEVTYYDITLAVDGLQPEVFGTRLLLSTGIVPPAWGEARRVDVSPVKSVFEFDSDELGLVVIEVDRRHFVLRDERRGTPVPRPDVVRAAKRFVEVFDQCSYPAVELGFAGTLEDSLAASWLLRTLNPEGNPTDAGPVLTWDDLRSGLNRREIRVEPKLGPGEGLPPALFADAVYGMACLGSAPKALECLDMVGRCCEDFVEFVNDLEARLGGRDR